MKKLFVLFALCLSIHAHAIEGAYALAHARLAYASTNVTSSAYVELISATPGAVGNAVEIFDSSGQTLVLAYGSAGHEVDQILITPGGNGLVRAAIPPSTRISLKAVSGTASAGEIDLNLYK